MCTWDELISFYEDNYEIAAGWHLRPGKKVFLGNREDRACRFCHLSAPSATFSSQAHAIPECIGNKSLFTYYECDECNEGFGSGCENDFANWSLPMRTMTRIRGKSGVPTIKGENGAWRIDQYPSGLSISIDEREGVFEDDVAQKKLKFHLHRLPYRPIMVVRAIIKMALSIMPDSGMVHFQKALNWIRPNGPITRTPVAIPIFHTLMSGPLPSNIITASLLTRKPSDLDSPFCFFILMYGHEMIQMAIPSDDMDDHLRGKLIGIPRFPCLRDKGGSAPGAFSVLSPKFDSSEYVKNDRITIELNYDHTQHRS